MIHYKDKGVKITGEYCARLLDQLKEAVKDKTRGK